MTYDRHKVSYLDMMVIKMEDGLLQTDIFRKLLTEIASSILGVITRCQ